ncbi:uncharacterized protein M421DRAFT_423406 [Didymella exigua CBS 183.55]|uniref:Uncharacterized protein n=1 Tax=Didymella exigua CBS 183.55 TaxID=1150837 RepID=A0A6A5RED2_9PLEO|nr:uncharacterized protein M421DRAFT_423406 [Didymella exigua CBS 183.55]KAF1925843.1 hypothetical protein M421DRAFT_423406 [Didymella exigua CBS 183.55]
MTPALPITLRHPSSAPSAAGTKTITPPTLSWLQGAWLVTHSSLPLWRKARNVRITYTPIPQSGSAGGRGHAGGTHLLDEVTYESLSSSGTGKPSTVRGVDKPFATADAPATLGLVAHADTAPPAATDAGEELAALGYTWRGKGWLMIATSKWEILGWGEEEEGDSWVVTYFAKTLFTPAGVDFYSRRGRLGTATVEGIKAAIRELGGDVAKLGGEVFEVACDGERDGKA